jgi:hypothetical protein
MAHGIDGGEVERMAGNARAHGRQVGRRRAVAAFADNRIEADIRNDRPRIGEAGERTEFTEQGGGCLRADARDGLQQLGVGGPTARLAGGQQRRRGVVDLVNRAGEPLELAHQRSLQCAVGAIGHALVAGRSRRPGTYLNFEMAL